MDGRHQPFHPTLWPHLAHLWPAVLVAGVLVVLAFMLFRRASAELGRFAAAYS